MLAGMGPLAWVLFGALAGWVASLIAGTSRRQGCLVDIVVGVVGALIGGLIMRVLGKGPVNWGFDLKSFGLAVLGAVLLLLITNSRRRR
jgi:uncharacterized membrane protein YeaQ/YmgE (transglycosylase-associated protein family)